MRATSKRILTISLAVSFLMPGVATAQENHAGSNQNSGITESESHKIQPVATPRADDNTNKANTPKIEAAQLCTKIGDLTSSVGGETDNRFNKLSDDFNKRTSNIDTEFKTAATRIAEARVKADAQRQANFAKLEAKATTDDQKQAVATFETSVKAAVATRRAAVDAADAAFRQAVIAAVAQRQTQLKSSATAYKTAVATAITSAKASCSNGVTPATVRANLQTSLKTARTNLQTASQNVNKVRPNLDPLKATRQAAIDKANTDFKAAVQQALATLKAALKPTS